MTASDVLIGAVLFTDLVGFTEFNDAMGDGPAVDVLDRQLALAGAVLASHDGARVVKELGDGLMIWVPAAAAAVSTACDFLAAIERERSSGDFPLAIRLGAHFGEVAVRGDDLAGRTVNIAARIADLAGPRELLVSEEVLLAADLADSVAEFSPVGPASVKGVADPIWLYRATDRQPV